MYQIEKDVPMPQDKREVKYPFAEMEVGDSFLADCKQASVQNNARVFAKANPPMKFKVRPEGDGARCWRVK